MAVSGSALLGRAALATDGGTWLLAQRRATTAAEAAAAAGIAAISSGQATSSAVESAADSAAQRNGFSAAARLPGTVAHWPPTSGIAKDNLAAVEAVVSQQQNLFLARVILSTAPVVTGRAVAMLQSSYPACILALNGGVSMGGNSLTTSTNCVLASNSTGPNAITVGGSATVRTSSLVSSGGCNNCSDSSVTLDRPYAEYQPPTLNPFAKLDSKTLPTFTTSNCVSMPTGSAITSPYPKAFCGSELRVGSNQTSTIEPGIYYLNNASLRLQGTLTCPNCTNGAGVTFIFTGDPGSIGSLDITAQASIQLSAPRSPQDTDYAGILFYRDRRATQGSTGATMNGGAGTKLVGGMYFPTSYVKFNGNSGLNASECTALVANTVDLTGTAQTYLSIAGCAAAGTVMPSSQNVRFVE
ncbi:MAG TPA: hypothetical protein VIL69_11645 [Roseomonas sp.]